MDSWLEAVVRSLEGSLEKAHHDMYLIHIARGRETTVTWADKTLVINYREGGGLQNGKIAGKKHFASPPQDGVKVFAPPLLKGGSFLCPLLQCG